MSSSQGSSTGKRNSKILRTRVKVWGRFALRPEEVFNVDKAEQLIQRAVDGKSSVQTAMKLYSEGLRIGEKGVLAAMQAQLISYVSVTAFISLRETPTLLALCNKTADKLHVTVLQFKDVNALETVCNIIDRQRGIMTSGRGASQAASSLSRSEATAQQQQQQQPKLPKVIVTPDDDENLTSEIARTTAVTTATVTATSTTRVEEVAGSSGSGRVELFEKRPFAADITQPPPASAEVTAVVHPAPSGKAEVDDDDDDENFRTSIVFGDDVRAPAASTTKLTVVTEETAERQQRMETLLQQRANGGHTVSKEASGKRVSAGPIETVILNYDEIDVEGTHAVFDTPDGPPIQLNESAENIRVRRPQSLQMTPSSSFKSAGTAQHSGASRYVVTSFSSGRSNSPTDGPAVRLSGSSTANASYRTSTVIYRDSPDSPTERPRVTYVSGSQRAAAPPSPQQQQQQMQLVRLVPVGSARRRVVHHQPQLYTIQPVSASRENGIHLVAK